MTVGVAAKDSEYYFVHSASLRIFGSIPDFEEITRTLGVTPTHTHRREDPRKGRLPQFQHDMWSFTVPVPPAEPLTKHLEELWRVVEPHVMYLKRLKEDLTVDVFCGYRTNCETAGVEIDHRALKIFIELEVPFGLSVIFA